MLNLKITLSVLVILATNVILTAQVKIGNNPTVINANSVLEIENPNKGLLMPRVALTSTTAFTPLTAHVAGMTVYNTATAGDVTLGYYYNNGTKWVRVADEANVNRYSSVEATGDISTSSATDVVIPGMTLSPLAGTYLVMFNGQYQSTSGLTSSFSTLQGVSDLELIYNQLMAIPVTNAAHAAVFGNGETLTPGVYTVGAVINVQGTLTLDGGGNSNALFIIRSIGAINTVAASTIIMTNGTTANNVFWIATGGAIGLGALTTMKGTLLAHAGAVAGGAGATLQGRMFSSAGAITFDSGIASLPNPSTSTYVNYRSLLPFVMFSSVGAVGNTGISVVTGDIGTNVGAITGFTLPTILNGNIYEPTGSTTITTTDNHALASFSLYQNGILIANSARINASNAAQTSLQAIATVSAGQSIDVRWKIDVGPLTMGNRILTLINVH
ncbi:MAG: ice-binding family protein [Bacteroidota bacterium]